MRIKDFNSTEELQAYLALLRSSSVVYPPTQTKAGHLKDVDGCNAGNRIIKTESKPTCKHFFSVHDHDGEQDIDCDGFVSSRPKASATATKEEEAGITQRQVGKE
jgi:hypothetical protein